MLEAKRALVWKLRESYEDLQAGTNVDLFELAVAVPRQLFPSLSS